MHCNFTVIPAATPSAPTGATGSVGGKSSAGGAIFNALVKPNGASTTLDFEYGIDTAYGTTITATGTVTGWTTQTVLSTPLTGLTCATTYHYRATAKNSVGTTVGADATFVARVSKIEGDFDGDGMADILWRKAETSETNIWFMNGIAKIGDGVTSISAGSYTATTGRQIMRKAVR